MNRSLSTRYLPIFWVLALGVLLFLPIPASAAEIRQKIQQEIRKDEKAVKVNAFDAGSRPVSNRYNKMIRDATEAIRLNPGEPTLYLARGWAFFELEKTDEQIADATMAINLKTKNGKAFFLRADGYLRQGRNHKALGDLTRAINLGEADEETYQHRALVFYYLGRFKDSVDLNSKLLILNPGAEIPRIDRGLANFCMGNYSEAFRDFGRVFEGGNNSTVTREFDRLRSNIVNSGKSDPVVEKALLEMVKALRDSKNPAPGFHYGECRSLAI